MGISAANLNIQTMTCDGMVLINAEPWASRPQSPVLNVTTSITIHNWWSDDAQNIRVIVVLPPTSKVLSTTPMAMVGPEYGPAPGEWAANGYVIFKHPSSMAVGEQWLVKLETQMLVDYKADGISAFVYGSVPNPDPQSTFQSAPIIIKGKQKVHPKHQPRMSFTKGENPSEELV